MLSQRERNENREPLAFRPMKKRILILIWKINYVNKFDRLTKNVCLHCPLGVISTFVFRLKLFFYLLRKRPKFFVGLNYSSAIGDEN